MRCHDRQAGNFSREEINDGCNVDDLAAEGNMGEIGRPDVMRITRKLCEKQIRERCSSILCFPELSASSAVRLDAKDAHNSFDLFPVHLKLDGDAS